MVYHVNEDKPTNTARVHKDGFSCTRKREKKLENGRWYGPLNSKDEALEVARNTGRRKVKKCKVCKP